MNDQPMTDKPTTSNAMAQNVMRHAYRVLSDEEKKQIQIVKDMGAAYWDAIDQIGASRELSLAKTKIEEAVMWAVKHITR